MVFCNKKPSLFLLIEIVFDMEEFEDEELGIIRIVRNVRSKNVIARNKQGYIQLTIPPFFSDKQILGVLDKMRPRLRTIPVRPVIVFSPESEFHTATFSLRIESKNVRNYHAKLHERVLTITCPNISNFSEVKVQSIIRNCIEQTMRHEAKRMFPEMLRVLAEKHGFIFTTLKINKSRTRWGSCSSKKGINLSYFCLLLPQYLIEFVMLHELCHTIEMNHGERFWQLLDKVTGNRAKALTEELKLKAAQW